MMSGEDDLNDLFFQDSRLIYAVLFIFSNVARQLHVCRRQARTIGHYHGSLDSILEFAHVAEPGIHFHRLERPRRKSQDWFILRRRRFPQNCVSEPEKIVTALAQRWK